MKRRQQQALRQKPAQTPDCSWGDSLAEGLPPIPGIHDNPCCQEGPHSQPDSNAAVATLSHSQLQLLPAQAKEKSDDYAPNLL